MVHGWIEQGGETLCGFRLAISLQRDLCRSASYQPGSSFLEAFDGARKIGDLDVADILRRTPDDLAGDTGSPLWGIGPVRTNGPIAGQASIDNLSAWSYPIASGLRDYARVAGYTSTTWQGGFLITC